MWFKISNIFKNKNTSSESPQDPEEAIQQTIVAMEEAIAAASQPYEEALQKQQQMADVLAQQQAQARKLYEEAMKAVKAGKEAEAKNILNRKAHIDREIAQYDNIYQQVAASVQQSYRHLQKMRLQLEEVKSKRFILRTNLAQAKTQKELAQKFEELHLSTDAFEEIVLQEQMEAFLELDELEAFDQALQESTPDPLQQVQKDIEAEEAQKRAQAEANLQKKMQVLFGTHQKEEKAKAEEKVKALESQKKHLLEEFFNSKNSESSQSNKKVLEDFLQSHQEEINDIDSIKAKIAAFSQEQEKIAQESDTQENFSPNKIEEIRKKIEAMQQDPKPTEGKEKKIEDFFGGSEQNKQKNIDDFFSNS